MSKRKIKRFEGVEFQFVNLDEAIAGTGTVLLRGDEMIIDIQDSADNVTVYLIVGKPNKHFYEGANTAGQLMPKVRAKWTNFGRMYIGSWLEEGHDYLFSFELPKDISL